MYKYYYCYSGQLSVTVLYSLQVRIFTMTTSHRFLFLSSVIYVQVQYSTHHCYNYFFWPKTQVDGGEDPLGNLPHGPLRVSTTAWKAGCSNKV